MSRIISFSHGLTTRLHNPVIRLVLHALMSARPWTAPQQTWRSTSQHHNKRDVQLPSTTTNVTINFKPPQQMWRSASNRHNKHVTINLKPPQQTRDDQLKTTTTNTWWSTSPWPRPCACCFEHVNRISTGFLHFTFHGLCARILLYNNVRIELCK